MRAPLPGFSVNEILLPSKTGKELYLFAGNGKHLRTINALTQGLIYEFTYDLLGRLVNIKDGNNNITVIERDVNGNPTGIVNPYGQRTTFTLDASGFLASITNPATEATAFQYTSGGLMTRMTTPRGHSYNFTYDSLGRRSGMMTLPGATRP